MAKTGMTGSLHGDNPKSETSDKTHTDQPITTSPGGDNSYSRLQLTNLMEKIIFNGLNQLKLWFVAEENSNTSLAKLKLRLQPPLRTRNGLQKTPLYTHGLSTPWNPWSTADISSFQRLKTYGILLEEHISISAMPHKCSKFIQNWRRWNWVPNLLLNTSLIYRIVSKNWIFSLKKIQCVQPVMWSRDRFLKNNACMTFSLD